ncbi:MAG: BREX-1 system adenine-specific DNA-methyltransferase PglX [Caldilinea sp.]|nr:BREX-1 system adenine-specific DNA-methyltransferase PglX [Caldilinea sp.]
MQPLDRDLRRKLESTIKSARDVAEAAARAALDQLGVSAAKPPAYLDETQRELRRRLRAHGRQLGEGGALLAEEVAYQHWHRMLFARWLAENYLLMYPDPVTPVAVTLEDCAELAADEGATDAWDLAARYAARMLPQIFRPTSPVFHLALPPEHQHALEQLVEDLDPAVFHSADGLGWVYQFWQSKRKDEVNAAEVKIGARELPAVTQLFTEPYMVSFLLDNALGAWWVGRRCGVARGEGRGALTADEQAAQAMLWTAQSEQELRDYFSLPGVPLTYLRFVREDTQGDNTEAAGEDFIGDEITDPTSPLAPRPSPLTPWRPAAGWFDSWPASLADLKVLDPCCGSGHFLVAVFLMLAPMRRALEGLDAAAACEAVLRQNIHGLEIDARCVEIAAFALALAAWRYPDAGGYRPLPPLNLACSGLAIAAKKEEWLTLAQQAADALLAEQTPSLLPDIGKESLWHTQIKAGMGALYDLFQDAPVLGSLINPNRMEGDFFRADYGQVAGLLRQMLADEDSRGETYEMGVVAQGLAEAATLLAGKYHWVVTNVPYLARGKQDETLRDFCEAAYPEAKQDLATVFLERCLEFCAAGGAASTVLPQNWLFLSSYRKLREKLLKGETWQLLARMGPGAFETISGEVVKAILLSLGHGRAPTGHMLCGLDVSAPRAVEEKAAGLIVGEIAHVGQAQQLENPGASIELESQTASTRVTNYAFVRGGITTGDSARYRCFHWEQVIPNPYWDYQQSSIQHASEYSGRESCLLWDNGSGRLAQAALSAGATIAGREAWGKLGIAITYTSSLKCSLYTGELFENIICVMLPREDSFLLPLWCFCSSDEFEAAVRSINQKLSVDVRYFEKTPINFDHWKRVAAERYPNGLPKPYSPDPTQWIFHGHPADSTAPLHVAVARLLGYRWPAESDRTMELADEARAWVERATRLLPLADKDGIVCLPPVRGELSAADRLTGLLAAAYGDAWRGNTLDELLAAAGWAGKSLDSWLRTQFFADHCKLFHHRPFLWHVWDGLNDGFAALVNYHRLDRKNLETLIYTYVGDWISRQRRDAAAGVDGAQARLAAAETLKQRLELILHGEAPYDIFVRWKPLDQQPVGWDPDLNDGVRLNIRPWLSVPDVGKKGAGVLRDKPNIKWGKDRGKDVESAPWFGVFGGERINDWHLTVGEKMRARGRKE